MAITLADRVRLYNTGFPEYPEILYSHGWIVGTWAIGNFYKRRHAYHGEFPPGFLKRVLRMFPDKKRRLFPFSGTLQRCDGITVDLNPDFKPDFVGSVEDLPFENGAFDLVVADPPYSEEDSKKYGYPHPSKPKCFKELARVTEVGGFLVWLDLMIPRYANDDWELIGCIGLYTGTNRRFRAVSMFRRPGKVEKEPLW